MPSYNQFTCPGREGQSRVDARPAVGLICERKDFMRRTISERGSVLLLEMLIVVSILGVILVMSARSPGW
jgi:hypothetical protein